VQLPRRRRNFSAHEKSALGSAVVATPIILKGSLFDEAPLGAMEYSGPLLQPGDVLECDGKSYTVTDLIDEDGVTVKTMEEGKPLIVIVEPLAVSQRRGGVR
jgi:hypothetical protein